MYEMSVIWTVGFLLMSVSCAINPLILGIKELSSYEAIMMNWVLPASLGMVTLILQNCWLDRAIRNVTDERTPIVSPQSIPGSYSSLMHEASAIATATPASAV